MERRADEDTHTPTRRQLLGGVVVAVTGGTGGCLGGPTGASERTATREPTGSTRTETATSAGETDTNADQPKVASVVVSDFIEYPIAGVHPHVHNRVNIQYVVVSVDPSSTAVEPRAVRERLGLVIDGQPMKLASEQPFAWQEQTVDIAFAVPKDETFDAGAVQFDGEAIESLSTATLDRLNNPPVFDVSDLTVIPSEIDAGERATATVQFTVSNTGAGAGTFGASVQGNYASGATTTTATVDAGATREVTADVEIIGRDEAVTVTFDWGVTSHRLTIPVVGTTATAETKTGTDSETETGTSVGTGTPTAN